jgi:glycosyltransferase involved in cell wall biosynthesis
VVRYAGVGNNSCIQLISNTPFGHSDLQVIRVPSELDEVSSADLITKYRIKDGQFCCRGSKKCVSQLKLALVGNFRQACGISTFNESLWPEIANRVKDFKLFIEHNDHPTASIQLLGSQSLTEQQVVACWKRGESLQSLAQEIQAYQPDVVLISHEWGLFPNARYWLSLLTQLTEFRVITTMHSIFPTHLDKTICEAAMTEVVAHLEGGQQALREKGVSAKNYLIPHGCYPYREGHLWNFYRSDKTFMQVGFGFRYKRFEYCIRAVALLKEKHSDVFFTALFSESPFAQNEHQLYFDALMRLVEELKVQENVAIIRGFQTEQAVECYLRTNQAAVFPYVSAPGHKVFGASGAARLAMAAGVPVISSSIPHFSDLPTIKADTPEQIAQALDHLFSAPANREAQIAKQIKHIEENSWTKVAEKYLAIFGGADI